jgi:hypothetical protein
MFAGVFTPPNGFELGNAVMIDRFTGGHILKLKDAVGSGGPRHHGMELVTRELHDDHVGQEDLLAASIISASPRSRSFPNGRPLL